MRRKATPEVDQANQGVLLEKLDRLTEVLYNLAEGPKL